MQKYKSIVPRTLHYLDAIRALDSEEGEHNVKRDSTGHGVERAEGCLKPSPSSCDTRYVRRSVLLGGPSFKAASLFFTRIEDRSSIPFTA